LAAADADFLKVFPESPAIPNLAYSGQLRFSEVYAASGSVWAPGLDEREVFFAGLQHAENSDNSWEVRLGKGGQLYSIRGPFGESQAPQSSDAHWMDQVFQFVGTNLSLANSSPFQHQYFVHQAGDYLRDSGFSSTFYSPMLASSLDGSSNSARVLVWGQQAQIPTAFRSGLLVYQQLKDLGNGVIELTHVSYNFGSDLINYVSTPWGGVRKSALPVTLGSNPDGSSRVLQAIFANEVWFNLNASGGWIAWTRDNTNPSSPTLALVAGKESAGPLPAYQFAPARIRYGTGPAENDFEVGEVNPFINQAPGTAYFFRVYLVVGALGKVQAMANALAPFAARGAMNFTEDSASVVPVYLQTANGQTTLTTAATAGQQPAFYTFGQPVPNSLPLFAMRNTQTGQLRLSTDPYETLTPVPYDSQMVYKPYDGTVQYAGFLGYVLPAQFATSKALLYENLTDLLTDRSYFPATATNVTLQAVAGRVNITSVNVAGGGTSIAPNTWIEIKGTNLAPSGPGGLTWNDSTELAAGRLPSQLGGVRVTVNGLPAYVSFVSPTQVNALTPLDGGTGAVQIQVTNGSNSSAPFVVNRSAAAPSFLMFGASHYIAATHADNSLAGATSLSVPGYPFSPVKPGETISLFGTGCGLPDGTLVPGSATQFGRLPVTPQIAVGGTPVTVTFAGVVEPGLCQFNIVVPPSAADGDNAVAASIGSAHTLSGAQIAVQH
jgi:uncharacterized protein (TIGR03437 family)